MSLPEPSIHPASPLPSRPEAKPRPPISRKPPPSNGSPSTPSQLGERGSTGSNSRGKVKSIVSKFSHPETTPTTRGYATPTANGTTVKPPLRTRGPRRAPTVKPKPSRASIQQSASPDQAPPLPMKRSRILRQQSDQAKRDTPGGEEGIPASRSAPDGKEVELQLIGGVEVEPEHGSGTPLSPCCDQDCSCVCHLHRPGMKLIWYPTGWPLHPPPAPCCPTESPHLSPPKTGRDDRRLSNISGHSINQAIKEQEEDGRTEGEKEDTEEDCMPVAPPRRGSYIDWESRLQDEPLYQTYRATVITKEIRRQTVCRNISKTSADYHMDWTARRGGVGMGSGGVGAVGSGTIPLPTPGQSTLWQDIPGVRDSGVLETLSPEQCKYQESMFEVLTSEASYLRSLRVLTEHFLDSRDLDEALIIRDRKTLFSNVLRVREVSERFLKDLEDRMDEGLVFSDICDIIHYHAQHNFPAYIDYVRNQIYQEKTYTSLMKTNVAFATVITRLQESPQCQRLPFMSFLLLPFQRITRIKMLIENILKRTKEGTTEEQTASKALDSVSKIIEECNTQVGKMKQVEELIHLSKTLEFDKLKAIPIISQTRFLEKRGEVQEMAKGGNIFNLRPKFTPVYLFLFNDLLIIATKKGSERFVVMDHAHRSLVQVQPIREDQALGPSYEHCFCLTLLENHQGRMMERLMKASSQSDLHRWIAAFPNPGNHDGDQEEVIYDDWDCPQVQCVEQYIAQQADELTLEPTEIINVVRKTNEGLYEGIRLSDGQKGWFPVENVLEITNEHVRRRNLRERYRVFQAASIVTNKVKTLP
uniref:rho guanine nucleotide exchange factor 15 n=1 Tax=Oncorhynchus gorbuscha TaxID=8017 RepID=UPI001EAF6707|nr:rho guanine nucleotide exchange factor 15 [Oncorhynchus gorbuscha]